MRIKNWHRKFHEEVSAVYREPWNWGSHDCCFFAARMVDAICGTNYSALLRQQFTYSNAEEAEALIKQAGGLKTAVSKFLGEPIPWGWASMGDVVLIKDDCDQEVLGVCEGAQVLVAAARGGVIALPMERCIVAWRTS